MTLDRLRRSLAMFWLTGDGKITKIIVHVGVIYSALLTKLNESFVLIDDAPHRPSREVVQHYEGKREL